MLQIADRVQEITNAAGSGTILLQGAVQGFRSISSTITSGNQIPYVISKGLQYEIGFGTATSGSPWTVTRDTIHSSSNNNQKINVEAGMFIFIDTTKAFIDTLGSGSVSGTLPFTWPSNVSATEVGYLDGVTSNIQTQIGDISTALDLINGEVL